MTRARALQVAEHPFAVTERKFCDSARQGTALFERFLIAVW